MKAVTTDLLKPKLSQMSQLLVTLRQIAQDYLAIQGSATPSEHAFSSGGITVCTQRNNPAKDRKSTLSLISSSAAPLYPL